MSRFRFLAVMVAIAMVATACGGDEVAVPVTTVAPGPQVTVEAPTTTEEESPETPPVIAECPEGFHSHEEGTCHADEETVTSDTTVPEELVEIAIAEVVEEVAEPSEDPTEEVVEPTEPEVVEEVVEPPEDPTEEVVEPTEPVDEPPVYQQTGPFDSEIPTLLSHSPEEVVWWYPNLMRDGYDLIDPNSVEATSWDARRETSDGLTPEHGHYVFYHGDRVSTLRKFWRRTAEEEFWDTKWYYYPVRYDVSWRDDKTVIVVGTYPLGETREVRVRLSGLFLKTGDDPLAPPLAPLPPFTEPDYPQFAEVLGRSCPSTEELWGTGKMVADPCTLVALQNAVQFAVAAATVEQTEAASHPQAARPFTQVRTGIAPDKVDPTSGPDRRHA